MSAKRHLLVDHRCRSAGVPFEDRMDDAVFGRNVGKPGEHAGIAGSERRRIRTGCLRRPPNFRLRVSRPAHRDENRRCCGTQLIGQVRVGICTGWRPRSAYLDTEPAVVTHQGNGHQVLFVVGRGREGGERPGRSARCGVHMHRGSGTGLHTDPQVRVLEKTAGRDDRLVSAGGLEFAIAIDVRLQRRHRAAAACRYRGAAGAQGVKDTCTNRFVTNAYVVGWPGPAMPHNSRKWSSLAAATPNRRPRFQRSSA